MSQYAVLTEKKGAAPLIVSPNAKPFQKGNKIQFWFYHERKQYLASRDVNESIFRAKVN